MPPSSLAACLWRAGFRFVAIACLLSVFAGAVPTPGRADDAPALNSPTQNHDSLPAPTPNDAPLGPDQVEYYVNGARQIYTVKAYAYVLSEEVAGSVTTYFTEESRAMHTENAKEWAEWLEPESAKLVAAAMRTGYIAEYRDVANRGRADHAEEAAQIDQQVDAVEAAANALERQTKTHRTAAPATIAPPAPPVALPTAQAAPVADSPSAPVAVAALPPAPAAGGAEVPGATFHDVHTPAEKADMRRQALEEQLREPLQKIVDDANAIPDTFPHELDFNHPETIAPDPNVTVIEFPGRVSPPSAPAGDFGKDWDKIIDRPTPAALVPPPPDAPPPADAPPAAGPPAPADAPVPATPAAPPQSDAWEKSYSEWQPSWFDKINPFYWEGQWARSLGERYRAWRKSVDQNAAQQRQEWLPWATE